MNEQTQDNRHTHSEAKPPTSQIPFNQPYASKISWDEIEKQAAAEGWQKADSCTIMPPQSDPCECEPENNCDKEKPNCDDKCDDKYNDKCDDKHNDRCDDRYDHRHDDHKYKRLLFTSWALLGLASLLALLSLLNTFLRQSIFVTVPYTIVTQPTPSITPTPTGTYVPVAPPPVPPERLW